jgi:hypothetical protein
MYNRMFSKIISTGNGIFPGLCPVITETAGT